MALQDTDNLIVQRNSILSKIQIQDMTNLLDDDLLVVGRGDQPYKIKWLELKDELGPGVPTAPVLDSVVLSQDGAIDANRFTSSSFEVTPVNSGGQAETLEMTAKVEGALDLKAGTEPILTNNYPGTNSSSVVLTLEGDTNLGVNVSVGDTVDASASYTPTSALITGSSPGATGPDTGLFTGFSDPNSLNIDRTNPATYQSPIDGNTGSQLRFKGKNDPGEYDNPDNGITLNFDGSKTVTKVRVLASGDLEAPSFWVNKTHKVGTSTTKGWYTVYEGPAITLNSLSMHIFGINATGRCYEFELNDQITYDSLTLNLQDETDIHLFQAGDEVQPGVFVQATNVTARTIAVSNTFKIDNTSNRSDAWSKYLNVGTPFNGVVQNVFDGNVGTFVQGEISGTVLWQPPEPGIQSGTEGVEIKFDTGSGQGVGNTANIFINGSEAYSGVVPTDSYAFKIPGSENKAITSLSIAGGNGEAVRLYYIKVAGKLLVDAVDDSRVWSEPGVSSGTLNQPIGGAAIESSVPKAFNGLKGDNNGLMMSGGTGNISPYIYTFTDAIPYQESVRFFVQTNETGMGYHYNSSNVSLGTGLNGWVDVATGEGEINSIGVYNSNGEIKGTVSIKAIEVDGKVLVDAGTDLGFGTTTVKTLTPKKGSGTISNITGSQVTITPFNDNCFKEGQWLTVDGFSDVTPMSDSINNYDPATKTLTLTGPKDLNLFAIGDAVTMSSATGDPPKTSTIQSIQGDYRTMSSTTYEGTDNRDTLFSDAAGLWDPNTLQVWNGTVAVYFDENYVSWSQKAMNAACEIHLYNLDGVMTCGWITGNPAGPYTYTTVITSSSEPVVKMAVAPEKSQNIVGFWFSGNGTMQKIGGWDLVNLQTITDKSWKLSSEYTLKFENGTGLDMFQEGAVLQDDPSVVYAARDDDKWGGWLIHFENNGRYWIVSPLNNFPNSNWNSGNKADYWEGDQIMEWTNDPTYLNATRKIVQARLGANSDIDGWRVPSRDVGGKMVTFYWNELKGYWSTGTDADYNEPTAQPTRKWRAMWDNGVKWGNINKINSTKYSPYRRMYETEYKSTVVSVDLETNTVVVNGGQWDGYEGQTIEVPGLDATGTVDSVNVVNNTITLSDSNDQWVEGLFVKGTTKAIGATTAYLEFDADGIISGYRPAPVPPRAMSDTTSPTLTFPATFLNTGTAPDDEFVDPNAYLQTSVQLKNVSGESDIVESNIVVPETTVVRIAAGESSNNVDELKAMWTKIATSEQRVADHTAQRRQQTVDDYAASFEVPYSY